MTEFDISRLDEYREHNQLEAKRAKGGFPASFWETYSAFANTDGGIILLGVREETNGRLIPEDVNVEKLRKDFWNMVNNRQKISVNLVTERMVRVEYIKGHPILVINVPRAERTARPVYVGADPKSGTFRRNHEGDYHCSLDEMALMFRDAAFSSQDSKVLDKMDFTVFCMDTVKRYRNFFRTSHLNHLWNNEDDEMFLRKIGAVSIGQDGKYHPTAAGLLMFGYEYEITREFPNYFLDYQENRSLGEIRWTDRLVSTSGEWSGNIFDFVIEVLRRVQQGLKIPFVLKGHIRIDDTPIHKLLREAVTNACVHADFYGRQGLVIHKSDEGYRLSNPGTVRISITDAVEGGISDPRNTIMLKIFSLIEFGERAGSGLSSICKRWEKVYHTPVKIEETHYNGVDRVILTLSTGGNEQDVDAMLEMYGDIVMVPSDIPKESNINQGKELETLNKQSYQNEPQNRSVRPKDEPQNDSTEPQNSSDEPQNDPTEPQNSSNEPQNDLTGPQKLLKAIKLNPHITKSELVEELGVSLSTLKRWLRANGVVWVGSSKKGHWAVLH